MKHGLHRWQQGCRLKELVKECGHLQFCLFEELGNIAAAHPELSPATFVKASRQLLPLVNETISESAVQYERMQQADNPEGHAHGGRDARERHMGDLGNLTADAGGRAIANFLDPKLKLSGEQSIIGRSVVVHAQPDDFTSQPSGDAGARVGCGAIEQSREHDESR